MEPDGRPGEARAGTPGTERRIVVAAATIAVLGACVMLAAPFLDALIWAAALAILAVPLHARLERAVRQPSLAAALMVVAIAAGVAVPLALIGARVVGEAGQAATALRAQLADGAAERFVAAYPRLAPAAEWIARQFDASALIAGLAARMGSLGAAVAGTSFAQVTQFLLGLYLLFYALRDRRAALRWMARWSPLPRADTARVLRRVAGTVQATILGTAAVAAMQGMLGGLAFWVLGLPAPVLWGLVMGLLSIVPVLGAFVVWIPAAIGLALDGDWARAGMLAAWGALVIGGSDNLVRPILVGSRMRLHTVPSFIAILGGVVVFGATGFILGPVIFVLAAELASIWRGRGQALRSRA